MPDVSEKKCTKCGSTTNGFYKNRAVKSGLESECKVCRGKVINKWQEANQERRKLKTYQWIKNNLERNRAIQRKSSTKRRSAVKGKLVDNFRRGINNSLTDKLTKRSAKGGRRWQSLVGYTLEQLMRHIESQFLPGMTWENYGKWHIDHRIPISAFNFEKPEDIDFKRCWELRNLRPLWAIDNIKKWAKLSKPFQPSLRLAM